MNYKIDAIVLGRGGTKGIPRKNVLNFCGKPLVAWSVLQAKNTKEIDNVYISSDSEEILKIGKKHGAFPIKRPEEISGDTANPESAVEHVLSKIDKQPDVIIMMEPTAPLRKPDDLSKCIKQFIEEKWDSGFSGAILADFLIWKNPLLFHKDSCGRPDSDQYMPMGD